MKRMSFLVIILTAWAVLTLTGCEDEDPGTETPPGVMTQSIVFDGIVRTYNLFIPDVYDGKTPLPLLFDIHGVKMDANMAEQMSGACQKGNEEGFIVVQPDGYKNAWNTGTCCAEGEGKDLDDIGLMKAILEEVKAGYAVANKRVYVQGLSNGGFMTNLMGCELTDTFAAIAPVAGSITYGRVYPIFDYDQCTPTRPIPVLMISGSSDKIVPFRTQDKTFEKWLELNRCDPSVSTTETFGVYTCTTYTSCAEGVETVQCVGDGVGHCWPGTDFESWGCSQDLDATDYIWDFVKRFQLP